MRLTIVTFWSALFISANVKAELNEKCQVKNKYIGTCTYLVDCQYYYHMIQNYKSIGLKGEDVFKIFREINCGYIKVDPLVCCPPTSSNGITLSQNNSALQDTNNADGGLISKPNSTPSVYAPNNSPLPTTKAPVNSGRPLSPPTSGLSNSPAAQSDKTETNEKFKLLPQECGRIWTFKFFRGNRTEFDDFPWTTLVEYETPTGKQFGCGGALINSRYVLTAAHCVAGLSASWKVSRVRFGEYDTDTDVDCLPDGPNITICNDQPLDVAVEEVIVHSGFDPTDLSHLHDIALLRLSVPVKFTDIVKPICLPTKNPFPQKYVTSGWGKDLVNDSIKNGTNLKYMSYVSLTNQKSCQKIYTEGGVKISQSHLCGGTNQWEKPCIGDGGGLLMGLEETPSLEKRITAFGVLSLYKPATGDCRGIPGVYTKVLDYMNWILKNLKE